MLFFDFEVFYKDWLCVIIDAENQQTHVVVNDPEKLERIYEENKSNIWVGYNCRRYDQYILKAILCGFDPKKVNDHMIVNRQGGWSYSELFNKIQLYTYDVMTSFHSLKQLEGFMGHNIKESNIPFTLQRELTPEEIEETIVYCKHDVEETMEVFLERIQEFDSHMSLIKEFKLPMAYISKTKAQLAAIILGAYKLKHNDEFDISIPDTLKIKKYKHIVDWYKDPYNRDYQKVLEVDVAGVPHVFAWGGLHGAIDKYQGEGIFVNVDVASYYPALMIEYDYLSRNVHDKQRYREIRDTRLELKAKRDPMQEPYKIVLNSTYGAMKDKYNQLFDPRQANNVCVGGQLLLLDLIEQLEPYCKLIQSNTDGLFVKINSMDELDTIKEVCSEWEKRTRMDLEYDIFTKLFQKDVNNYIIIHEDGSYESKGAYVKKLNPLDNDLPIVNKALVEYFINGTPVDETINRCNRLIEFQKIVKVSEKYTHARHGNKDLYEKVSRVFASNNINDGPIVKVRENKRVEKIANTPNNCFIMNGNVERIRTPRRLDRNWYIETARKRLEDFGISMNPTLF